MTYKRKAFTTMAKNKNVKKTLEAGVLTKCHSENEADFWTDKVRIAKNAVRTGETERTTVLSWKKYKTVRRIPYLFLKRFFAKYKFPFAGNCVRPSQNDGKILVSLIQYPTPKSKISTLPQGAGIKLPSSCCARGEGHNNVKYLFTYSLINLFTSQKKAAFTLAEVLITLGIIGVVAAMTIPNLIAERQKKATVVKLQRAISVLNQAYRLAYDDVGELTTEEALNLGGKEYYEQYWAPYLKSIQICKTASDCGYDSSTPFTFQNGHKDTLGVADVNQATRTALKTMDGFVYVIYLKAGNPQTKENRLLVDINGGAKPNKWGKDVFFLYRATDGEKGGVVVPYGYDKSAAYINNSCSKNSYGWMCAEKIRRAGWKIEKDYPW